MDDRHSATSIYMMAMEAIRKAVMYHHTRIRPCQVEMQNGLKDAICAKIRDQPGGTLAIRARNVSGSEPALKTFVVYRAPAAPGSRREAREKRRCEAREQRRQESRTDVSDDDALDSGAVASSTTSNAGARRKRRARRSLIRRLSYYPPRAPETRQVVLDFVNLEKEGADFTPPLNGEEFYQAEDNKGTSDGMESDFDETNDPPPPRPYALPAPSSVTMETEADFDFSPTASTRNLVQSLSVSDSIPRPSFTFPSHSSDNHGDAIWTLGLGSLNRVAPIVPDADAAAAAMWQATEAAWDAAPALLPPVPPTSDQILMSATPFNTNLDWQRTAAVSDQERLGEGMTLNGSFGHRPPPPPWPPSPDTGTTFEADSVFNLAAAAASLQQRPVTPPPVLAPLTTPAQLRLLELCAAMTTSGLSPNHIVSAYLTERAMPGSMAGYAGLRLPSERTAFRRLHAAVESTLHIMMDPPAVAPEMPVTLSDPQIAPVAPASAPPSMAARVNVVNIPGLGTHRIETEGDLPATFTNRGRMKRQREARAASAAAIAEAHAAAAAHAARERQLLGEETLVAGPSAAFDHDRRKARRLVEDASCDVAPTGSGIVPQDTSVADAAPPPLQRVLGAVVQHPTSAATTSASVHTTSCPCEYCPSGMIHRHRSSTSLPSISTPLLPMQHTTPLTDLHISNADQEQRRLHNQMLLAQQLRALQQHAHAIQSQQYRSVLPFEMGAALRAVVTPPSISTQTQAIAEVTRLMHLSSRLPNPQSPNEGPTMPRMDPTFYYSPMAFLSVAQPSAPMPPPSFVDHANPVMSRQHMFNPATSSLSTAAAAALAATANRPELQHGGESSQQLHNDRVLAQFITLSEANREFHALLSAGIPPPGEIAPIGATQRDIEKYSVAQQWKTNGDIDVDPCTVCMYEFKEGENVRELACHHSFHVECIDPWLSYNKKCPNCRIDLDQPQASAVAATGVVTTDAHS